MKISVRILDPSEERAQYCQQLGVDGVSLNHGTPERYAAQGYGDVDEFIEIRERLDKHNLDISAHTLSLPVVHNQLLGLPGREREAENVCRTLQALGEAGIPNLIVDQRISTQVPPGSGRRSSERLPEGRGGTLVHTFDASRVTDTSHPIGTVSPEEAWDRIFWLYERIVPVAEEAGVNIATHPDDPPVASLYGVSHVLNSIAGLRKLVEAFDSPRNGLLFCAGTMQEAGEDAIGGLRWFCERKKVFYLHYRNVRGTVPRYAEVFPDEGDLDMVEVMRTLRDTGFDGWVVNDHCPTLLGDEGSPWQPRSIALQVGYIQGVMQALEVERTGRSVS